MRKSLFALPFVIMAAFGMTACDRVHPGFVGIKVERYGSDKGVQNEVVGPGSYWTGVGTDIYTFPTFEVTYEFTHGKTNDAGDPINFQSQEGMQMSVDVGIQFQIERDKVPLLFQKYRKGVEEIAGTALRAMIRDTMNDYASRMTADDIIGRRKTELNKAVEDQIRNAVRDIGISVKNVAFVSEIRVPPAMSEAINAKMTATQKALQRENEVQEAKAMAQKEIEKARGVAESTRLQAIADAEALNIRGESLRRNPEVLQLQAIEKWNGILPQMIGGQGAVPFINVTPTAKPASG